MQIELTLTASDHGNCVADEPPLQKGVVERASEFHELHLDAAATTLTERGAKHGLDLGYCGGWPLVRLLKDSSVKSIHGGNPSVQVLRRTRERLHLDKAGDTRHERLLLLLLLGSLNYGSDAPSQMVLFSRKEAA